MRSGRVQNYLSTGIIENNVLTFSDSREGTLHWERLASSKRGKPSAPGPKKCSKLALEYVPSVTNSRSRDESDVSDVDVPTQPTIIDSTQPMDDDKLFATVMRFYQFSRTIKICYKTLTAKCEIANFLALCLSNRCKKSKTIAETCKFMNEYLDFALEKSPKIPFTGKDGLVCLVQWLISIRSRGITVPRKARYFVKIFGEAMGIDFPVSHPGVIAATRVTRIKPVKHAPMAPMEFIRKIELLSCDLNACWGLRVACSLVCLMVYASLRYSDTRCIFRIWRSGTALCGESTNWKNKNGDIMQWAAPLTGIENKEWTVPLLSHWERIKPSKTTDSASLFPWWDKDWTISEDKQSTPGTVQATLSRLEKHLGMSFGIKIHSPRSRIATCAHQLLYPREDRERN